MAFDKEELEQLRQLFNGQRQSIRADIKSLFQLVRSEFRHITVSTN